MDVVNALAHSLSLSEEEEEEEIEGPFPNAAKLTPRAKKCIEKAMTTITTPGRGGTVISTRGGWRS